MLINRRKKSDIDFSRLYVIYIPGTCVYVMHADEEIHVCMDLLLSKCVEIDIYIGSLIFRIFFYAYHAHL